MCLSSAGLLHFCVCIDIDTQDGLIVVQVSTKVDEQITKECLDAGMDDLLSKPVTMSQLVTVLRTLRASRTNCQKFQRSVTNGEDASIKSMAEGKCSLILGQCEVRAIWSDI